jgi:septal ring factor EnvC (AmiA/AmiB activator)
VTGKLEGVVILAKEKAPVRFVASGTVIGVSPFQGYGMVVFVQAKSGYLYVYGGMELVSVKNGDKVVSGMNAGVVGIDMKIRVPAAYFFVTYKGKSVDPATAPRE